MHDVFISYPRAARAQVLPIKERLQKLDLSVFFDIEGIDGGDEFPVTIDRAVKSAKAVLGCWSELAFTRPWVMRECRVAQKRSVLVPVAIERFPELSVPTEFFGINYLDLTDWNGAEGHEDWRRTLGALGRHIGRALTKTPQPELADEAPPKLDEGAGLGAFADLQAARIDNVWITFKSPGGRRYRAICVQHHPSGPYVLLSSEDKDRYDFLAVMSALAQEMDGLLEDKITDRGDDLCVVITVNCGFTDGMIPRAFAALAPLGVSEARIEKAHRQER